MVWRPAYLIERMRLAIRDNFARLPEANHPTPVCWSPWWSATRRRSRASWDHLQPHRNHPPDEHLRAARDDGGGAVRLAGVVRLAATAGAGLALARPEGRGVGACLAALGYALLAGLPCRPSAPCTCCWWPVGAAFSGRIVAASRILALALLVVLLIDPWAVLAAGFWLSFGRRRLALMSARPRLAKQRAGGRSCGPGAPCSGRRRWPRCPSCSLCFSSFRWCRHWPMPSPFRWSASSSPSGLARCADSVVADSGAGPSGAGLADAVPRLVRHLACQSGWPGAAAWAAVVACGWRSVCCRAVCRPLAGRLPDGAGPVLAGRQAAGGYGVDQVLDVGQGWRRSSRPANTPDL